jgi:hypothetical protein
MSGNYKQIPFDTRREQAWGVAAKQENGLLQWCYGQGPDGFQRYTERAAKMEAFASNNAKLDAHFVAVAIPNAVARFDLSEETYGPGPRSEEGCAALIAFRKQLGPVERIVPG